MNKWSNYRSFRQLIMGGAWMVLATGAGRVALAAGATSASEPLVWAVPSQTNHAKMGDVSTHFTFKVRNASSNEVVITDVKPSCGCTVATLPSQPWRLAPKQTGQLEVLVDLRSKRGNLYKSIAVNSPTAPTTLNLAVEISEGTNQMSEGMANRAWGQQLAAVDHQSVFKDAECIKCHLVPAFGKSGGQLYEIACGICHESPHRASMVPDLHALKTAIEPGYWRNWVAHGKAGTLMPGFAAKEGGPLDDAQINSLVGYLSRNFPRPMKSATDNDDAKD